MLFTLQSLVQMAKYHFFFFLRSGEPGEATVLAEQSCVAL